MADRPVTEAERRLLTRARAESMGWGAMDRAKARVALGKAGVK